MPNLLDLINQGSNNGGLEQLAQLLQLAKQQDPGQGAVPTEKIAGYDIPINRGKRSPFSTGLNALSGLATGFAGNQQMQKRNQFMQSVQQISQEQSNPDEKINKLVGLMAQHGSDYGLGLKDIITQYGAMSKKTNEKWQPTTREEALAFEKDKAGLKQGKGGLSPYAEEKKRQRTEKILTFIEDSNLKRDMISEAGESVKKISSGLYGKLSRGWMKNIDPNNPILGEWQKIKMVLTDAQLLNTAKTKGAISDQEMTLFASAAANDDLTSLPRIMPVLNRLLRLINAEERGLTNSYRRNYGDEALNELGLKSNVEQYGNQQFSQGVGTTRQVQGVSGQMQGVSGQVQNQNNQTPQIGQAFNGQKVINVRRVR